jgi:hypothetical protein
MSPAFFSDLYADGGFFLLLYIILPWSIDSFGNLNLSTCDSYSLMFEYLLIATGVDDMSKLDPAACTL